MTKENKFPGWKKLVFLLGGASFFTDAASQMVYPLLPDLITALGAGAFALGMIEGLSEGLSFALRAITGNLSDRLGQRKWFLVTGYLLSGIAKPLLFFAGSWGSVLGLRLTDRVGKAVRTPSRDALLATATPIGQRGWAFGVHQAMDRSGSLLGPLLAMLILWLYHQDVKMVFLWTAVPAAVTLFITLRVKEPEMPVAPRTGKNWWRSFPQSPVIRRMLFWLTVFNLGHVTETFLVLKVRGQGLGIAWVPLLWVFAYGIAALTATFVGKLSDKIGRKNLLRVIFGLFATVSVALAFSQEVWQMWVLFPLLGGITSWADTLIKASLADHMPAGERASIFGWYDALRGIAIFFAAGLGGFLWENQGSVFAFILPVAAGTAVALGWGRIPAKTLAHSEE